MNRLEFATEITERTGIKTKIVLKILDNFHYAIRDTIIGGDRVVLRGFGTLMLKPKTTRTPLFVPSKLVEADIKKLKVKE